MAKFPGTEITDRWVTSARMKKNPVDPFRAYAIHKEPELSYAGIIEDTGTIFLANRECPFRCLMCDLWKNTTDHKVPSGAIPGQIKAALAELGQVQHVKLYNSGNFFDKQAIPPEDYSSIVSLLNNYSSVIIENHPNLINDDCLKFRDILKPELEIAMGLETVHPEILPKLNKKMTLKDFEKASRFLHDHSIRTRAFILLKTPFMEEQEGVEWAKRSIDFAFDCSVSCCVVIPTRSGNGALDQLEKNGYFSKPSVQSLEEVLAYGIDINRGRVFADLWDLGYFSECDQCLDERRERMSRMNLYQELQSPVLCSCT